MKLKIIITIVVIIIVGMQFVPVDRENPVPTGAMKIDLNVKTILERSCFDCHSNNTEWPWYSKIAPVSFFIAEHVEDGRKHLNFSDWNGYKYKRKLKKLEEIKEEIEENNMPLDNYTWMHPEANLTFNEKKLIYEWTELKIKQLKGGIIE